ncbi:MAG TPA: hypothetical protein VK771_04565 [Acidimicrobiia bacterium]|nr:hypothetical protein [Acidimicrobiia bacterium]
MRGRGVRRAALSLLVVMAGAACSSAQKGAGSSTTVFPTVSVPSLGSTTSAAPPTTHRASGTKAGGPVTTSTVSRPVTSSTASQSVTPVTPATSPAPPTTSGTGVVMRWKLALDFRTNPGHNPFSSYLGGTPVWSLREGATLSRDGNYPLLPTFSSTFGSQGIAAWHDSNRGCPSLPAVGVNSVGAPILLCTASIPGDGVFLDPDPSHSAVVAWTSPFTGTVNISNDAVANLGGTCFANGVSYYVDLGTGQLASVRLTNNNAATLPAMKVRIANGQSLYFIIEPGSGDRASCDATQLAITIDRLG